MEEQNLINRIKFYLIDRGLTLVVDQFTGNLEAIKPCKIDKSKHVQIEAEQAFNYSLISIKADRLTIHNV